MSKRREIEVQLRSLGEIREIMNAMKNLALMEVHRLSRFLEAQRTAVLTIEAAAADFFAFHSGLRRPAENARDVVLLIGSERGFCGDFNEVLGSALDSAAAAPTVVIGDKLGARLTGDSRVAAFLSGASVVEEVGAVLNRLMDALNSRELVAGSDGPLRLTVYHHEPGREDVRTSVLDPFPAALPSAPAHAYPPLLNLEPVAFVRALAGQYLFAALHRMLYDSLMVENQRRMQHMDAAVRRLDRSAAELSLRRNVLRQEEITEEIEVIMLGVRG